MAETLEKTNRCTFCIFVNIYVIFKGFYCIIIFIILLYNICKKRKATAIE
jgi:hypothetical protein